MKRSAKPTPAETSATKERFSFSLYPADLSALENLIADLGEKGLALDRTKVVRALLHTTSELDLFAYAVIQHREDRLKPGPREWENVAERFTIEQLGDDADKLDRVVASLAKREIKMNDSYVLRSLLRRLPPVDVLVPLIQQYLEEFPDRRSRAARAKKNA